jgi:ABC-type multidrug transport system fused ATPase/permease subunit
MTNETSPAIPDVTVWTLLWTRADLLGLSFLLIAVNRAAALVWPYLSKYLVDEVITRRSRSTLLVLVGAGILATSAQAISAYLINRTVNLHAIQRVADLRKCIHEHALRLSVSYYDANKVGAMVSRMMNDLDGVRNVLGGGFVSFVGAILTACIAFVVLLRINAIMTLVLFSVIASFSFLLRRSLSRVRPLFREANAIRADVIGRLTESLGGIRVVKSYRAEAMEHDVFTSGIDRHLDKTMLAIKAQGFMEMTVVLLTGVVSATVMYFGGAALIAGNMTVGDLFRYVMFMGILVSPLLQAVSVGTQFNEAFAGLERIRELGAQPREDQDASRSQRIVKIRGEVRFESVGFAYGDNPSVLHDLSFRAEPGTVTALVGSSGSGKSTITGLIAGFYKPSNGAIWVDDYDLSRLELASYRGQLGIVPQDVFLFSGTILENVALSRPCATDQEIVRACNLAHVDEFACRFWQGYQTIVGERGVKLSMGQRQRIAIARAILADPRILILDEATSSLDSVSEAVIQEALSFLLHDRTTFVIAHRLSTIRRADQILVVEGGRIIEHGTHETLFAAKGTYFHLYTTQQMLQSNLFLAPGEADKASERSLEGLRSHSDSLYFGVDPASSSEST